jgi:serine/threonine protein kinase
MHGEHTQAQTAELRPGDTFADHRIEGVLGQGGMGVVYRATDLRLNRPVALKVIKPELSLDEDFRRRFRRESELAASVRQPNVVTIYQAGESGGLLFVTMDLIHGTDLRAVIGQHGRLDLVTATEVTMQVAAALDAAHSSGLVHRDVKPANVLVAGGTPMHVYLTDFGLTKKTSSQSGLTKTGLFVGTLDYAAPEQIQGWPVDARADVYALGCVLFEMLTGRPPFRRDNDMAVLYAHMTEPPPSPHSVAPDLPAAFDDVIARALAKNADDRYPSAGDLARAAAAAAAGELPTEPERIVAVGPAAPAPPMQVTPQAAQSTELGVAPAPVAPAPPPPQQPPSHVTNVLPPAAPRKSNPWPAVVLAVVVLAIAGAIAVVLITKSGDNGGKQTGSASNGQTITQQKGQQGQQENPPPVDAQLRADTEKLGKILDLSAEGRADSAAGDFTAAQANRQQVLGMIDSLDVVPELKTSRDLLRSAINASLSSTFAHQNCGNCAEAQSIDKRATAYKLRFVNEFNQYAQKYLQRSYDESKI